MARNQSIKYYNTIADVYDWATEHPGTWNAPHAVKKLLEPRLRHNMKVLDLGIGTGSASAWLTKKGCSVFGLDASTNMLRHAKRALPSATLQRGNISRLHTLFENESFDIVMSVGTLEFVPDLQKTISDVAGLLSTKGMFCFTYEELLEKTPLQRFRASRRGQSLYKRVPSRLSFMVYRHTWSEVRTLLRESGFDLLAHRRFVAYHLRSRISGQMISVIYRVALAKKV